MTLQVIVQAYHACEVKISSKDAAEFHTKRRLEAGSGDHVFAVHGDQTLTVKEIR